MMLNSGTYALRVDKGVVLLNVIDADSVRATDISSSTGAINNLTASNIASSSYTLGNWSISGVSGGLDISSGGGGVIVYDNVLRYKVLPVIDAPNDIITKGYLDVAMSSLGVNFVDLDDRISAIDSRLVATSASLSNLTIELTSNTVPLWGTNRLVNSNIYQSASGFISYRDNVIFNEYTPVLALVNKQYVDGVVSLASGYMRDSISSVRN